MVIFTYLFSFLAIENLQITFSILIFHFTFWPNFVSKNNTNGWEHHQ